MTSFSGGCLCGHIRYATDAEPVFTAVCHCRDCQRSTGSAFSTDLAFRKGAVRVEGALKTYEVTADSGLPITRGFCPTCGSGVTLEAAAMPGLVLIAAGTLDDTASVRPGVELFCDRAQPWVKLEGDRPHYPAMPPR
jgi:hypothetical protein